jgi:hypothetical protein
MKARAVVAGATLGVALALPAPAAAVSTSNDCLVWAGRHTLVEQSKFALVFSKDNPHVNSAAPTNYACVFSREKAFVLPNQGEGATPSGFQLDGRYVGYTVTFRDPAVAESGGSIVVFDAKAGTTKVSDLAWPDQPNPPMGERGFSDAVTSFVINGKGSAAWIARMFTGTDPGTFAVVKREAGAPGHEVLDRGADIGPSSMAKARDDTTIFWTRGGVAKTAPLG